MIANVWMARGEAELELAGQLFVTDDGVMAIPSDLDWLAETPVEVWTADKELEVVGPFPDPERFLFALERHYSGSAMRVEVDLDDDELAEAYNPDQERAPAGSPGGGQWTAGGGGGSGAAGITPLGTPPSHFDAEAQAWVAEMESHPEFVKAREIVASQIPTNERYSQNGVYTAERAALHDEIVQSFLNPKAATGPGEQPVFVLYAGAGGSGKSTTLGEYLPLPQDRFTVINADDAKAKLPEYIGYNAATLHEESSHIADRLTLDAAITARHNIVFDGTGKTHAKYAEMAGLAHRLGYRVEVLFAAVEPRISAGRAADRFLNMVKNGHPAPRYVDPRYLLTNVDGRPHETYEKLKASGSIDRMVKVDNNANRQPRLIEDIRRQREARSDLRPRGVSRMGRHRDPATTGRDLGAGAEDEEGLAEAYNPDQPREPAGSPGGGRFAGGSGQIGTTDLRQKMAADAARVPQFKGGTGSGTARLRGLGIPSTTDREDWAAADAAAAEFRANRGDVEVEKANFRALADDSQILLIDSPIVESRAMISNGINEVSRVTFEDGDSGVWKPESGEQEMGDYRQGMLWRREVVAYSVAAQVGMEELIPVVAGREHNGEMGAMLSWVDGTVAHEADPDTVYDGRIEREQVAMFDMIMGNADRHQGNWILDENQGGRMVMIDHGFTLPVTHDMGIRSGPLGGIMTDEFRWGDMGPKITPAVQNAWRGKGDQLKATLRSHGIEDTAITLFGQRYDAAMRATNWGQLMGQFDKIGLEVSTD